MTTRLHHHSSFNKRECDVPTASEDRAALSNCSELRKAWTRLNGLFAPGNHVRAKVQQLAQEGRNMVGHRKRKGYKLYCTEQLLLSLLVVVCKASSGFFLEYTSCSQYFCCLCRFLQPEQPISSVSSSWIASPTSYLAYSYLVSFVYQYKYQHFQVFYSSFFCYRD